MATKLLASFVKTRLANTLCMRSKEFIPGCRTSVRKFSTPSSMSNIIRKGPFPKLLYGYPTKLQMYTTLMQLGRSNSLFSKVQTPSPLQSMQNNVLTFVQVRHLPTLNQIRRQKPRTKKKKPKPLRVKEKQILLGPQRKGVCVKLVVRTPKKPNSAQRKCAILRLSNGKLITAYIPGEKGSLQEHGVVLFEGGRVQDCPGIKYKIIRRKYDMN